MNQLTYLFWKHFYKSQNKRAAQRAEIVEGYWREKYIDLGWHKQMPKVYFHQTGFNRHYTRFFTSTLECPTDFGMVDDPTLAEFVVFINTIDEQVIQPWHKVLLFFHEPNVYAHLYQSTLNIPNLKERLLVVAPQESVRTFVTNPEHVRHVRSIPYVHFHHQATAAELDTISVGPRRRSIVSITSGLDGMTGYSARRNFLDMLGRSGTGLDLYGRFSKAAASLPAYRGPAVSKWQTLARYQYNLVIENSNEEYYISEKIFDSLICGCLPIYYGSEKIFDLLPDQWFYHLPSLDESEIPALQRFLMSDAYRQVAENRREVACFVYERFSFFSALKHLLAGQQLPISPEVA